jgi:hypothetical protein
MSNADSANWIHAIDDSALLEGHMAATGEALSGPVPAALGHDGLPPVVGAYLQNIGMLMSHVRTESVRTYRTKLEAGWVEVAPLG